MAPSRPVLRWHGGKWLLADWIISHFPPHRVYVEPFGGAGSVLLQKPMTYAEVYNDLDDEVVNLFAVLRNPRQGKELKRLLHLTPFARVEFDGTHNPKASPIQRARALVIRAFMGFGSNAHNAQQKSGFRANSVRSGNTPALDWKRYPGALDAIIERLRGVVVENKDAQSVMAQHDGPQTLHYVDPPYVHSTRAQELRSGRQRDYKHEMDDQAHRDLARQLHQVKGMVVLSGYLCPLYSELYGDWTVRKKSTYADGARPRVEALWLNPAAAGKQVQMNLLGV